MDTNKKSAVRKKRYTKKRKIKEPYVNSSSDSDAELYSKYLEQKHKNKIMQQDYRKMQQTIEEMQKATEEQLEILRTLQIVSSDEESQEQSQVEELVFTNESMGREATKTGGEMRVKVRAAMARRTHVSSIDVPDNPEDLDSPDSIEVGTLTIQDSETKSTQKELWERPPRYCRATLPEDNSPVLLFEILSARIMPPEGEDVKVKRYVVYELTVRQDSRVSMDQQPTTIERRYTDFRDMFTSLKRDYPLEMSNIDFPSKVLVGNFSASLIADRGQAFEDLLTHISRHSALRSTSIFLDFLQNNELTKACQLLDERNDACIPLLENSFMLLNKIFMDRSKPVLLILCRLVAACTSTPVPHQSAEKWAALALNRYETLCDIDLLPLYIPLLHTCAHLWWQKGRDQKHITDRLTDMSKKGISINNTPTLVQAIHKLDPRSETI